MNSSPANLDDSIPQDITENSRFTRKILDFGFLTGVVIAGISLILSAVYLYCFLWTTSSSIKMQLDKYKLIEEGSAEIAKQQAFILELAINSEMVIARIALISCGVFVGMSFGFLGFSLFLIGVRGEMDVSAQTEKIQVKVARMSPGVFVITSSVILIAVCVNRETPFKYLREQGNSSSQSSNSSGNLGLKHGVIPAPKPGPKDQPEKQQENEPGSDTSPVNGLPGVCPTPSETSVPESSP
ncbi:hypothetical protein V6x_54430 [Gimesia chilikensis]|uniref:Uncharacterized protein n=1 Tax=Gimesia chilikensis TaxID=2605989 RepID=A0A517WKB7_9PLAN|nr:hypothetical protein [Gimesia chilikensis]QDU05702.1 hypothetical protein V6x_54430 [Gimesia chilikensis]